MIDSSTNGAIQFGIHIQKHKLLSILCIREGSGNPLQYSCLETPMDRERSLVGCSPWGREDSDTTEQLHFHFSLSCKGNGNPLQCSCLENPRDRGAWWAAIYGVAQSQTRLKQLSSNSSILCIIYKN